MITKPRGKLNAKFWTSRSAAFRCRGAQKTFYHAGANVADCKRQRGRDLFAEHQLISEKTLLIGDMVNDAEVAEVLGCHVLLVADGHQAFEVLSEVQSPQTKYLLASRFPGQ